MQPMKQLRIWHAFIAVFATAVYLSEDVEPLHQLLGYGVVILISGRLLMAIFGAGALGLQRFYPKFRDLKLETAVTHPAISRTLLLGIAAALLGAATTGIFMDKGQTLQTIPAINSGTSFSAYLVSDDSDRRPSSTRKGDENDDDEEGWLGEVHEFFANLLMGVVALHVIYLLLFKWPLARFMLFVRQSPKAIAPKP